MSPSKPEVPVVGPRLDDVQAEKLGRKASALPRFRLMPGMRVRAGLGEWRGWHRMQDHWSNPPGDDLWPDLRDPATLGCVQALVRERWPDARPLKVNFARQWVIVRTGRAGVVLDCSEPQDTEAEALVAALEAAS